MIRVTRSRQIQATPSKVFEALSDAQNLPSLLPRVRKIELIEQGPDYARIATHMAFGPFGTLRSEGEVRWRAGHDVVFSSTRPVPIEARWELTPTAEGTDVQLTLALNLQALIGPLAAFVPPSQVTSMIEPDLDAVLARVDQLATRPQHAREVAL